MKKLSLVSFLLVFIALFAFGDPEEIDYLLFLPNNSSEFVNEAQAMTQLDNLAKFLSGRELTSGQIFVYGYAAFAVNDIDPLKLSRDRALYVIGELERRGVSRNFFSDPVGYGSVDLWGANTNEEDRIPNRRVRIVLDGNILTPETIKAEEPKVIISSADDREPVKSETKPEKSGAKFPWWLLLLLLLLAALIYLLSRRKKSPTQKPAAPVKTEPAKAEPVKPEPVKAAPVAATVTSKKTVNLDEEIRKRAFELYVERGCVDGNEAGDWYDALLDVSAKYEAKGYQVYFEGEYWWASIQETKPA